MGQTFMGVDYSNLNPHNDLSLDVWSGLEVDLISDVFSGLQAGNIVDYPAIDTSTIALRDQLNNPTYGQQSLQFIEAIYNLNADPGGQAHVLGHLLVPENLDLVTHLLGQPDNPLVEKLGTKRAALLIDVAGMPNETDRTAALAYLLQNPEAAVLPNQFYENVSLLENREQHYGEDAGGWMLAELLAAIQSGDVSAAEYFIDTLPEASLDGAALDLGSSLGDSDVAVLNQLMDSPNTTVSDFSFSVFTAMRPANTEPQVDTQLGADEEMNPKQVDTASLEAMLMSPAMTPATMVMEFAGAANLKACMLELLVR